MDTYVEDDNSYETIPEVHEPPKHEGKPSGTVQFKTSFKANKVVVHPLILRVSYRIISFLRLRKIFENFYSFLSNASSLMQDFL